MPTAMSPTIPSTPTENDAVAARLKAAPRRAGERRAAGRGAGAASAAGSRLGARGLLDGGLAREREQSRGGLEFVDIGCRGLRDRTGEGPDRSGRGCSRAAATSAPAG